MQYLLTIIISLIIIIALLYYLCCVRYESNTKEDYSIVLGMLGGQKRFLDQCNEYCFKSLANQGDQFAYPGMYNWKCTDKCQDLALKRLAEGKGDISYGEYMNFKDWKGETDIEGKECIKDVESWCRQIYCPFSSSPGDLCMSDCLRTRSRGCLSGMYGQQLKI